MKHARVSEAFARPARGAGQSAVAFAIVEFVASFYDDLTTRQYAASVIVLGLVLSSVQALVENHMGRALLRSLPPEEVPTVDTSPVAADAGQVTLAQVLVLALIVLVVLAALGFL